MCYSTKISKTKESITNRFDKPMDSMIYQPQLKISGFTFPITPVIANSNEDLIQGFQWGLIPHWAKDDNIKKYTLNAKIETLSEKPSYRGVIKNRCLVIVDGFYEWQWLDAAGKKKQMYEIGVANQEIFTLGGLWSEWVDKSSGEIINTYSIVTTAANELMSEIHNTKKRMPVVLDQNTEMNWLHGDPIDNFKSLDTELVADKC
jgi:putative SOS response-associated peptidase YedK